MNVFLFGKPKLIFKSIHIVSFLNCYALCKLSIFEIELNVILKVLEQRSLTIINKDDLIALHLISKQRIIWYFTQKNKKYMEFYDFENPYCVALCQGAAMHYHDFANGVKDFDIWFFFKKNNLELPPRMLLNGEYHSPRFIQEESVARRVDILFRSIIINDKFSVTENIQNYLSLGQSKTAKELAKKAVVLIHPNDDLGKTIWYNGRI